MCYLVVVLIVTVFNRKLAENSDFEDRPAEGCSGRQSAQPGWSATGEGRGWSQEGEDSKHLPGVHP